MQKPSATVVTGFIAVVTTLSILGVLQWRASGATIAAGFWYEDFSFALPEDVTSRIGGPLTQPEIDSMKELSRAELTRAFSGLRISVSDQRDAFWRVRVLREIRPRGIMRNSPRSGEAYAMGPLGGAGTVSFLTAVRGAVSHAPPAASRQDIIGGIGRGMGRAAVHEFSHAIVGAGHSRDRDGYEYWNSDRFSQYYGQLHWTTAWPAQHRKFAR